MLSSNKEEAIKLEIAHTERYVKYLDEEVTKALSNFLAAQDLKSDKNQLIELNIIYEKLLSEYENAKLDLEDLVKIYLNNNKTNSHSYIQSKLSKMDFQPVAKSYSAQVLQIFSHTENEKIQNHYKKIPDDLKKLLDVVLIDENISQEVIVNPVFIKKDGRVYDLSMIEKIIASNGKNPFNQEMVFKKEDIIPCNTLIKAIQLLLLIIDQHKISSQPVEKNTFDPSQEILSEAFYQKLPPKHQRLFDIICRDPMTNIIMKDPVFLPDGYAYDRSTAEILLESAKIAECPLDKNILFTKEDITKCYLIDSVYEYLKKMAAHQTEILIEEVKKVKIL